MSPSHFRTSTSPSIAVDLLGSGPAVVFIHGVGADRRTWQAQLPAVAASGRMAVAVDLRGYLDSEASPAPLSIGQFADDVLNAVQDLGITTAHLVGQSMGGIVVQHLLAHHPALIRTATLLTTTRSLGEAMTEEQIRSFLNTRRDPLEAGRRMADLADELSRAVVGPETAPKTLQAVAAGFASLDPQNYIAALEAVVRYRPALDPAGVDVPVLVVSASDDRLTPPAAGRALASAIRTARYVEMEGAGHMAHMEKPDTFNAILLSFLDAVDPIESVSADRSRPAVVTPSPG